MIAEELIVKAYAAYNRPDADALLALVSEDIDWPDGRALRHGKQDFRSYRARHQPVIKAFNNIVPRSLETSGKAKRE